MRDTSAARTSEMLCRYWIEQASFERVVPFPRTTHSGRTELFERRVDQPELTVGEIRGSVEGFAFPAKITQAGKNF
ncbi:hypothetical protein MAUB_00740 [Mycolicibacterium aubagnense]|uniref:Uncharacterized protein n=1 Tax=Mycolicibacterium aubagnense TaxID=319707 RepID=A0ABN5YKJ9_9MYCO|nr:hypothetical protein C1S80_29450 [Mycolicibacterium aubagnense]BBX82201.1 hypothetical protein MAUB_00740 [Mycolicibacterium aubagnense]